jgi:hypothetical protein
LVTKVLAVIISVWPSGAARAAVCVPMLPLAPGLLSTMTGWFQRCRRCSPTSRARMSMPVPGVKGTMMVIGRSDRPWARSLADVLAQSSDVIAANAWRLPICMPPSPVVLLRGASPRYRA